MRKLLWMSAVVSAFLVTANLASAQKDVGPALEVRVRSVNDLLDKAEYLGDIVNQGEAAKQGAVFVRGLADAKTGLEGVDTARPFGLYGSLTPNVVDSPVVLMIPVADEKAVLNLLSTRLSLDPKKGEDGSYEVRVPNVPVPLFFRFAHQTLYVTAQSAKGIDPSRLIEPKAFFAGMDESVASVRVHLDRIPEDVKNTALGQFELNLNDAKERAEPNETPAQKKLRVWALDRLMGTFQSVLADGKDLSIRLLVDPKTDNLTAEATFTARSGSGIAKVVNGIGKQTGKAVALAGVKNPVASVGVRYSIPETVRKELEPVIDALIAEQLDKVKGSDRQGAKMALEAIAPTLKAGELDAGFVITGDQTKLGLVGALGVAEGTGIEKTIKQFAPFAPEDKAKFEFDVRKSAGLTLHKVAVPSPELKASFGTETVWLATSDKLLALSIESDGKSLEEAVTARMTEGVTHNGVLKAEFSVARILAAVEKQLSAEKIKQLTTEVFPEGVVSKDTASMTIEGGDALKLQFNLKGKAMKLAVLVDQEKKK
jgi:hypothetical protein